MSTKINGPERLQRFIELMMRHWVTNDVADEDMGTLRMQAYVDRIENGLGLTVIRELRFFNGGRPMMAYHLPRQTQEAVEAAIAALTEVEMGCTSAIKTLHDAHPFIGGDIPVKPGISGEENARLPKASRGDEGEFLTQTILKLLQQPDTWLTSRYIKDHYGSTRLAAIVHQLKQKGHVIDDEERPNANGKGIHSAYHIFTDQGQRDAWFVELAGKRYMQRELKDKEARGVKLRKPAHKSLAVTKHSGGSAYGGWVKPSPFAKTAASAGPTRQLFPGSAPTGATKPSSAVMARLGSLQTRPHTSSVPTVEVNSPPEVPAALLNRQFPAARSKDVVELGGTRYFRKFRPRTEEGRTVAWETSWDIAIRAAL